MDLEIVRKQRESMIDYFISNQDVQPSALLQIARIFKCKAKLLKEKNNKSSNVRALEARLRADCLAVVPLLKGLSNNQTADSSSLQLYEFVRKSIDKVELTDASEEDGTMELVSNKLAGLTLRKNQTSEFSFLRRKKAQPHVESANSAAQQVVQAIESLKQENQKDRRDLISKLDELIKVTIAKDEKLKNQSSFAMPENAGVNFNFLSKSNIKTDPSPLFIFGSNETITLDRSFGPLSNVGQSELIPATLQPTSGGATSASTTINAFSNLTSMPTTSMTFTTDASMGMTFGNATTSPTFNNNADTPWSFQNPIKINATATTTSTTPGFVFSSPLSVTQPTRTGFGNIFGMQPAAMSCLFGVKPATTTSSSSLFGNAANSSSSQPAASSTNWSFPSSAATSPAVNFFGPKTATITPIIASPKDDGKKENSMRVLPTNHSLPFSLADVNIAGQQPVLGTNSNTTFVGAKAKELPKGKRETSMEQSQNRTNTNDVIAASTMPNVFRAKADNGWTVLHSACADGNLDFVKFLVEKGADVNAKNESNETVLHYSCAFGKMDIVAFLIEKGAGITVKGYDNRTVLHYAAQHKKWDVIKFLVDTGADVQARDGGGTAVLHCAAKCGEKDIIKFLVNKGADVRAENNKGETALQLAAYWGQKQVLDIIKLLLEKGADINAADENGWTALLFVSTLSSNFDKVKCLVENGANVHAKNEFGNTALHQATYKYGSFDMVQFLVDNGADVNAEDNKGETALHFASKACRLDIVEFLIEKGADIDVKNKCGQTALHFARQEGDLNIVRCLIEKGSRCQC